MRSWIQQPDLANYGLIRGIKEVVNNAFVPFVFTCILGVLVLLLPTNADKVLIKAIEEFMQTAGFKILFISGLFFSGLSLFFANTKFLSSFFRWSAQSLSAIGFQFTAVLAGVLVGIAFPAAIEAWSYKRGLSFLMLGLWVLAIEYVWFSIAYVSHEKFIQEAHKAIGNKSKEFSLIFGALIMSLGLYALITVEWPEINNNCNNQSKVQNISSNSKSSLRIKNMRLYIHYAAAIS